MALRPACDAAEDVRRRATAAEVCVAVALNGNGPDGWFSVSSWKFLTITRKGPLSWFVSVYLMKSTSKTVSMTLDAIFWEQRFQQAKTKAS